MRFKVGDKVKFAREIVGHTDGVKIGEVYKIIKTDESFIPYKVENGEWFSEEELELEKYTYEDLKKSPLGTKVTFENKGVLLKTDEGRWENRRQVAFIENLEEFKDIDYGKIIKIEEPTYSTVYEYKPEILDEVEKRYLRGVIRPFRDKVKTIRKTDNSMNGKDNEYLTITLKEEPNMDFPNFKPNTMYKGMKLYKEYTLEELGL